MNMAKTTEETKETKELTFAEKVMKIQQELVAPKDLTNTYGNYKYRSCERILEAVKPLLAKYGLGLTITDEVVQIGQRYYIKATATIWSENGGAKEVSAWAREQDSKKGMDESQITGSASSYARKYALNGLFCIDDTKDADTNEQAEQTKKRVGEEGRSLTKEEIEAIRAACSEKEDREKNLLEWAKVDALEKLTLYQYETAMKRFGK
jgi:hypothetical protein